MIKHENLPGNNNNDLNKGENHVSENEKFLILFGEEALARKCGQIGENEVFTKLHQDSKNTILNSDVLNWSVSHQDFSELFFLANNANNWNSIYPGDNIEKKEKENSEYFKMKNKEQKREERDNKNNEEGGIEKEKGYENGNEQERNDVKKEVKKEVKKDVKKEVKKEVKTEVKEDMHDKVQHSHTPTTLPIPVMLEMIEPNPDTSSGMDKWLFWYESLKSTSELLQSLL